MKEPSTVYKETYEYYLDQISKIDFSAIADKLSFQVEGGGAVIPVLNQPYFVTGQNITSEKGEMPPLDISVILSKYLIMGQADSPGGDAWVSYRDFKDSGPLTVFYKDNVEKQIEKHFTGRSDALKKAGESLGGYTPAIDLSYDLSMQFDLLPKLPMLLLFNDVDDEFPATCSMLFKENADTYLDAECLAMAGSHLALQLIKAL